MSARTRPQSLCRETPTRSGITRSGATTPASTLGNPLGIGATSASNQIIGNTFGNDSTGVSISGPTSTGNQLFGNFIGTDSGRTTQLPNGTGVLISAPWQRDRRPRCEWPERDRVLNTGVGLQVTGAAATGNLITQNSIYDNVGRGIALTGVTGSPAAPTITSVTVDTQGTTNVTLAKTGLSAGAIIEVFASGSSTPSTTPGKDQARNFVGSHTVTPAELAAPGSTITFATSTPVPLGQSVTATLTPSTPTTTSPFATGVITASPFVVTTIADSGLDANPTPGSLRAAIINANNTLASTRSHSPSRRLRSNGVWTLNLVSNLSPRSPRR